MILTSIVCKSTLCIKKLKKVYFLFKDGLTYDNDYYVESSDFTE